MKQSIETNDSCIGCSACYAACTHNAIRMTSNKDGFYVPKVDPSLCTNCGVCKTVCPLRRNTDGERRQALNICRYGYTTDAEGIKESTSGGIFYALANDILSNGGVVCGCIWDEHNQARHVCTSDRDTMLKMRGSKYVQSYMGDCFIEIRKALYEGKKVLFCGTPCQTTALKRYLRKEYDNLITCALICGGVPSPKVYTLYKKALEEKMQSKIVYIHMRSKKNGWLVPHIEVRFENGKELSEVLLTRNLYGTNFGQGLFINDECMNCKFKLDSVDADIIIGDHWGIGKTMLKKSKNMGASVVITLSQQGEDYIQNAGKSMNLELGNLDAVIDSHHVLTKAHIENNNRMEFFAELTDDNILQLLEKYYKEWQPNSKLKKVVYNFLYSTNLYTPLFELRWKLKNRN